MPELPEVETIRRDLAPALAGARIRRARIWKTDIVLGPLSPAEFRERVRGRRIRSVDRRGKYLLFRLEGELVLQVQLRMTGRFALGYTPPDPSEFRHIAAEIEFQDGRTLYYDDTRRLGGFRLLTEPEWCGLSAEMGPEPLSPDFTAALLRSILAGSRAPVKSFLLNQRRLAGVGNIYASEALHRARVDPRREARSLDNLETRRLHRALRQVLRASLRNAGTTFRDYRALNGRSGAFQNSLRVYGREGESCTRCGGQVHRTVQAGRSTFFCPGCQH